ncbi:ABC transporter ATP-binding protein [Kineococcus radiotolerans]|uniref:ABC transporter related n=1 Tax=Kineococcus radiotolerans (strain ATCC BAA-149 / DSM 14245 / SRS30216) TaxID=266940 RepID=A6WFP8_KINRD|nr:ATP-binding cassette domain-containing protein [Kineococcus radiotolerans]ABS05637.1 ABC transporter related [Kineococcus radiotolerans SRS30216 = ATCC BAA-149]
MLVLEKITRRFGDRLALDDVSLSVPDGRMVGFVGANGAGKTTTMRIALGVLAADSGTVTFRGRVPDLATRRRFGYMPEERGLYPKGRLLEQLVFLARLHGVDRGAAAKRGQDLLSRLGLGDRAQDKLESLSLGNQQRVQVAASLVHDPELLVLDEPFSGLDPLAVDAMADLLRERVAAGVGVLFSSHQLDLVDRLCDELVILHGGRVVAAGEPQELRRQRGGSRYRLVTDADPDWLRDVPGVRVVERRSDGIVLELLQGGDLDQRVLAEALRRGPVRSFAPLLPTLSELFQEVSR